ncbi:MAG TPA: tyrosine-protein phosphatase [Bacilli bacterium]|nr:tyrosine-protein phosphatase [Bacilli bacterium]
MPERYLLESVYNFRDIGGYPLLNGKRTKYGVLFRSGSLSYATKEDVKKIEDIGIKTIIDLRGDKEHNELPDLTQASKKITAYHLPVNGGGRVPVDEDDMLASYMEMVEEPVSARAIFSTIAHAEKPILIHCTAGKDRTGVFTALLLALAGVTHDDINADYLLSIPYLRAMMSLTLDRHPDFPRACLFPKADFLSKFWNEFRGRYGLVSEYLDYIGLSGEEIDILSHLLK